MGERVIQGFFVGGQMHAAPGVVRAAAPAGRPTPVQRRAVPGPPLPDHAARQVAQRHGTGNESFEVDSARLGLNRGGGAPLPQALLAKMEAAFGVDFSAVRVHVGPQAARIGAVAFTTGNDLYFAPGQYQPSSMQGQQLIGHELAHVIQQRQGRVRARGLGVSVVQDRALETEADRLGMRAAAHVAAVQPKVASGVIPAAIPLGSKALVQRVRSRLTARTTHPEEAVPPYRRITLNDVTYLYDGRSRRWRWDPRGHWVRMRGAVPLYGRFEVGRLGRGGFRAASLVGRLGTGAGYARIGRRLDRLTASFPVTNPSAARRTYRRNMLVATTNEGVVPTPSARVYAMHFGAPAIAGGYNWCHLIGHGAGGSDRSDNLLAASTHANSEQLAIERIVYNLRRRGLRLRAGAQLFGGLYAARYLYIQVLLNNDSIYTRWIDGFRATAPTFHELRRVEHDLLEAIDEAQL